MSADGGRLIVVSNRLGDPTKPAKGGLAVAMNSALNEIGGVWMGFSGDITDAADGEGKLHMREEGKVAVAGVDMNQSEYDGYYSGFANSVLWPAFHHRMDLIDPQPEYFSAYRRVNRMFAQRLGQIVKPNDVIWVQDYHLIPLGMELRAMGLKNRIGFFLHIPLPPSQMMQAVPDHGLLMRSLFYYDLVGLHTRADVRNFRLYAERVMGVAEADCAGDTVTAFGRSVRVQAHPIGVDVDEFRELLGTEDSQELVSRIGGTTVGRRLVTGVDRLDYSKGLPERMKIFRRLLQKYPENHKQTTLVQIASPTRESVEAYAQIRDELAMLSGSVNGEFGMIDWTPIRYIHRHTARERLAGLYSISKVGLVTPLRDGMNLVAKEYVAVQPDDDPGVLVLSEFAGAAEEMTEALLVNPHDIETSADQVQRALTMDIAERKERHQALKKKVEDGDVIAWSRNFLRELRKPNLAIAA